jgi:DNA modification methylase
MNVATALDLRQVEPRRTDAMIPYAKNARTHSDAQVEAIARSIDEFGWTNPVLVDEHDGIVAGHGRVLAAQLRGIETVPVIVLRGLTPAQVRAYCVADNKLAELAGWDFDLLKSELRDLNDAGFDVSLMGFSEVELDSLLGAIEQGGGDRDPDEVPDFGPEVSVRGDLWKLGHHRVLCGDATQAAAYATLLGDKLADVCWTDPPYNVNYKTKAGKIDNDDLPGARFREFLDASFGAIIAHLRPGGGIYVAHADTEGLNFRAAFEGAGFKLSGVLIWKKDSLVLGRSDYQWIHEPILYGWRPGHRHRWAGGRKQTTVSEVGDPSPFRRLEDGTWAVQIGDEILIVTGDAEVRTLLPSMIHEPKPKRSAQHPTMKPTALIERMLRNSSRAGDVVLDPFGGSGSTLIAAERLGLSARLLELAPRYVDVIVRRWQEHTGRDAVHAVEGKKFAQIEKARAPKK